MLGRAVCKAPVHGDVSASPSFIEPPTASWGRSAEHSEHFSVELTPVKELQHPPSAPCEDAYKRRRGSIPPMP